MYTVVLVGGGYSIKEGIDEGLWWRLRRSNVWSVNYAYQAMTDTFVPAVQLWQDLGFWIENQRDLIKLHSRGCQLYAREEEDYRLYPHVQQWRTSKERYCGREGIKFNTIFTGRMGLTGVFALSLAVARGFDRIYLLGYDFGTPSIADAHTHFYSGQNDQAGNPHLYRCADDLVRSEVSDFDQFRQTRVEIVNVTSRSNIESFPKIGYAEFFKQLEREQEQEGVSVNE